MKKSIGIYSLITGIVMLLSLQANAQYHHGIQHHHKGNYNNNCHSYNNGGNGNNCHQNGNWNNNGCGNNNHPYGNGNGHSHHNQGGVYYSGPNVGIGYSYSNPCPPAPPVIIVQPAHRPHYCAPSCYHKGW